MARETDARMVIDQRAGRAYAEKLQASFIVLSNRREHYFWDYGDEDARAILGMPARSDLQIRARLKAHRAAEPSAKLCRRFRTLRHSSFAGKNCRSPTLSA